MPAVRRVLPHEYHKYADHLKRLDDESRYLRFGFPIKDDGIDRLFEVIDKNKDRHILFCVENNDLEFIAVGHIALDDKMEMAFSVLKSFQDRGIGNELMRRCIQWCRTQGILKGFMVCLSSNAAIRHLCVKNGMKLQDHHGETLTEFEFDHATIDTWIGEAADQSLAVFDWVTKRANNFLKTSIQID